MSIRVVKVPAHAKRYFTANELSGYMDGINYSVSPRRKKKRKRKKLFKFKAADVKPIRAGKSVVKRVH